MISIYCISLSDCSPGGAGSSVRVICLLGTGRFGHDNCGVFFFSSFGVSGWLRAPERFFVVLRETLGGRGRVGEVVGCG